MRLETERLVVRTVEPADREALARIWNSQKVTRHLGGVRDKKAIRRALKDYTDPDATWDLWVVEAKDTGRVVGHCGLLPKTLDEDEEIEIVYVFAVSAWGQGYATEVVRALIQRAWRKGLTRIVAMIAPENEGSIRVARKLGFVHERTLQQPDGLTQVWVRKKRQSRS